jgi:hypothetical protein
MNSSLGSPLWAIPEAQFVRGALKGWRGIILRVKIGRRRETLIFRDIKSKS